MDSDSELKALYIKAYYEDLEKRVDFLAELDAAKKKDEALMLCCCYIEALGSRESTEAERKANNYCAILTKRGNNEIWGLIHLKQLKNVISSQRLFKTDFSKLESVIDGLGSQLINQQKLLASLNSYLNQPQQKWLQDNLYKSTMANISYERIRCELVHDISGGTISFSETTYKDSPVPDLDFKLLYSSLRCIVEDSKNKALVTNKWWYEQ